MTIPVPAWLSTAIGPTAQGTLTIATIAGADLFDPARLDLTSPAFDDGDPLDPSFTASEEDAVAPPLKWSTPPEGTQEMVLVVEDADAPPDRAGNALCHWLVWGLAGQRGKLLEGETPPRIGKNSRGNSEWLLPDPPEGDAAHRYVFQLFALDRSLPILPGATREQVVASMKGHVIACAVLTGMFATVDESVEDWDDDEA